MILTMFYKLIIFLNLSNNKTIKDNWKIKIKMFLTLSFFFKFSKTTEQNQKII